MGGVTKTVDGESFEENVSISRLVFLQNAWSPVYAGKTWPRKKWLAALAKSRSGKRLSRILDDNWQWVWNVSPKVTAKSNGVAEPDLKWVRTILTTSNPRLVLACGSLAAETLMPLSAEYSFSLLIIPHPAHRLVTNVLLDTARYAFRGRASSYIVRDKFSYRLRQERGRVAIDMLSDILQ